jgi:hypothetical protein
MASGRVRVAAAALVLSALAVPDASAQVFGTFTWQMQPYCNNVTLTLTSAPTGFRLDGSDDQCGAATKGSAAGIGVFNPDGSVGINFTIIASPSGRGVQVSGIVSPANGQGTWTDSAGNSGTFAFFGATPGLPTRPLPATVRPVFVMVPSGTPATTVVAVSGLKITAVCPGTVTLHATTSVANAVFASQAQFSAATYGITFSNFGPGVVLPIMGSLARGHVTFNYALPTGEVVAGTFSVDDRITFGTFDGCEVTGFVTVR